MSKMIRYTIGDGDVVWQDVLDALIAPEAEATLWLDHDGDYMVTAEIQCLEVMGDRLCVDIPPFGHVWLGSHDPGVALMVRLP